MLLCVGSVCKGRSGCSSFYPAHTWVPPPKARQLQNHRQTRPHVLGELAVFAGASNKAGAVPQLPPASLCSTELNISAQADKGTEHKALRSLSFWACSWWSRIPRGAGILRVPAEHISVLCGVTPATLQELLHAGQAEQSLPSHKCQRYTKGDHSQN